MSDPFTKAVTAIGTVLGGIGAAKSSFSSPPKAPEIPKTKPPATAPMADEQASRYAAQKRIAQRKGSYMDTFFTRARKAGETTSMLG